MKGKRSKYEFLIGTDCNACSGELPAALYKNTHLIIHNHIHIDVVSWSSRKWTALQGQLLQTS